MEKREFLEVTEPLTFSFNGDSYEVKEGRTYFDEAFPGVDRKVARQVAQHALFQFHTSRLSVDEVIHKVTYGYDAPSDGPVEEASAEVSKVTEATKAKGKKG